MASVYVITTRQMDEATKKAFYQAVNEALVPTFPLYCLMLQTLPNAASGRFNQNQTAAFICVPPTMDLERRRTVAQSLESAMHKVFPSDEQEGTGLTVIFPYHTADCCGKHGVLRCDVEATKKQPLK